MKKILKDLGNSLSKIELYNYKDYEPNKLFYPLDLSLTLEDIPFYFEPRDDKNIPMKVYASVGKQYNPTRIASYALANYHKYLINNKKEYFNNFIMCADWFMQVEDGIYRYNFEWNELNKGWFSCMAQGEAISVLIRAYIETEDEKYLNQAIKSTEVFKKDISKGGVLSKINNELFFEEYPVFNAAHTLNGYLYGLVGLIELKKVHPDIEKEIPIQTFISTLKNNIHLWSTGKWSLYDLSIGNRDKKNYTTVQYHKIHISLLKYILKQSYDENLEQTVKKWEKGYNNLFQRVYALCKKIAYRINNPAQR